MASAGMENVCAGRLEGHTTWGGSSHAATWHSSCSSVRRSLIGVVQHLGAQLYARGAPAV